MERRSAEGTLSVVGVMDNGDGSFSVGLYHGTVEEYRSHFCIPYHPAEPTDKPNTYRCPDLLITDDEKESRT